MKRNRKINIKRTPKAFIYLLVLVLLVNPFSLNLFTEANSDTGVDSVPFSFELLNTETEIGGTLELKYTPLADGLTDVTITFPSNLTYLWGTWNEADLLIGETPEGEQILEEVSDAEQAVEETMPEGEQILEEVIDAEQAVEETVLNESTVSEESSGDNIDGVIIENTEEGIEEYSEVTPEEESEFKETFDDEIIIEDPLIALASFKDLLASNAGVITNDGYEIAVSNWANLPGSCIMLSFRVDGVGDVNLSVQGTFNGEAVTAEVSAQSAQSGNDGTDLPISNYECTTHTLKWSNAPGLVENTLSLTPTKNEKQAVKIQVNYSFGGILAAKPGEIEIRVPQYILYDRSGAPANTLDLSALPTLTQAQSGTVADTVSFCYFYEGNEIVITNFKAFNAGTFTCEYTFFYMPYQIADGFSKNDIQATFSYKHVSSGEEGDSNVEITDTSDLLTVNVATTSVIEKVSEYASVKYETWQTSWGTAPAGAANYFYVVWSVGYTLPPGTQPYSLVLMEDPGEYGQLVLFNPQSPYPFTLTGDANKGKSVVFTTDKPSTASNSYSCLVVVKYPKSLVTQATPVTNYTNTATLRLEGVDGAVCELSTSAFYVYQSANFSYTGDSFSLVKSTVSPIQHGAINTLENNKITPILNNTSSYYLSADVKGWGMTNDGSNYGSKDYTVDVIDDLLYLAGERLQPEDYSIYACFIDAVYKEYAAVVNADFGLQGVESSDYANYKEVIVYCKTLDNPSWQKLGSIKRTSASASSYTPLGGVAQVVSQYKLITLPQGAYAVKVSHTSNNYSVNIPLGICVKLNPTDHVLRLVRNQSSMSVYNIGTMLVTDWAGTTVNTNRMGSVSGTLANDVIAYDLDAYGSIVQHSQAYIDITKLEAYSTIKKSADTPVNDTGVSRIKVAYTIHAYDAFLYTQGLFTKQDAIDANIINEQTNGVFYDLLPVGTTVNLSTLRARRYNGGSTNVLSCSFTVRFVENWQGSNQTMMIVEAKAPEDTPNYYTAYTTKSNNDSYNQFCSGFTLEYTLYYPWDAYQDYGSPILNSVAYRSQTGTLTDGNTANSSDITKKQYYVSLEDENGNADDTANNTIYTQLSTPITLSTAAELGLSKSVKGAGDMAYSNTAEVPAVGNYTYRLRFANQDSMSSKNLVLYDVLEQANPNITDRWYGTLQSIDVSQAVSKGIAPVVYYSTVFFPDGDLPLYKDVTDNSIWSTTPPVDLSTVTAVAVDLSKTTGGADYVFQPKETVYCYITMRAPDDYEHYINPKIYAYNRSYYSATALATTPYDSCEGGAVVTVSLRAPSITINKASDPSSGTQAAPMPVNKGNNLTYTIKVRNTNIAEVLSNVIITDDIPAGLAIDFDHMQSSFGSAAASLLPNARVSVTQSGQQLVFTVNKLTAGEEITLTIPCTVTASTGALENAAVVTSVAGKALNLASQTTYHKINNEDLIFKKTLNGRVPGENVFEFELKEGDVVVGTAVNDENGIILIKIPATAPGTYEYTISEVNNDGNGLTCDPAVYKVRVILTNEYGVLTPQVTYLDVNDAEISEIVFNNEYHLSPLNVTLQGRKVLTGKPLTASMFSFIAKDSDSGEEFAAVNQADGSIAFTITCDAPGTYNYTLREVPGGPGDGTTHDNTSYTAVVNVVDNGDGTMHAETVYPDGEIVFNNQYTAADVAVTITAQKILKGAVLEDGMFNFAVQDETGRTVAAAANKADGSITFSNIRFSDPGTYVFTVEELPGSNKDIDYDNSVFAVTVKVTDNTSGSLTASVQLPVGGIQFMNNYVGSEISDPDPADPDNIPQPTEPPIPTEPPVVEPGDTPQTTESGTVSTPDTSDKPSPTQIPLSPSNERTYIYEPDSNQYKVYNREGKVQNQIELPITGPIFIYVPENDNYTVVVDGEPIGYVVLPDGKSLQDVILEEDLIPLGTVRIEPDPQVDNPLKSNPKTSDSHYIYFFICSAFILASLWLSIKRRKMKRELYQ